MLLKRQKRAEKEVDIKPFIHDIYLEHKGFL